MRIPVRLPRATRARNLGTTLAVLAIATMLPVAVGAQIAAPVDIQIPVSPSPVLGDGEVHLVYELHVTSYAPVPVAVTRLRVQTDEAVLLDEAGPDLRAATRWIGVTGEGQGGKDVEIAGGGTVVLFAWVTVAPGEVPVRLVNELSLRWVSSNGETQELDLALEPLAPGPKPVVISPPLRGEGFLAANGPANDSGHRRALIATSGHARIAQRFAIDWVRLEDGGTNAGDREDNSTYHIWGDEALAVADGTVVDLHDGVPENVPGESSRAVEITLETVAGNYVTLDLGGGYFAFYAHLQPGSLRASLGDRVRRGQVLGLVGNSGNSTEPHLHFHVSDGPKPLGAEGLPYVIDHFTVTGSTAGFGQPVRAVVDGERALEIPMANVVVRFAPTP